MVGFLEIKQRAIAVKRKSFSDLGLLPTPKDWNTTSNNGNRKSLNKPSELGRCSLLHIAIRVAAPIGNHQNCLNIAHSDLACGAKHVEEKTSWRLLRAETCMQHI